MSDTFDTKKCAFLNLVTTRVRLVKTDVLWPHGWSFKLLAIIWNLNRKSLYFKGAWLLYMCNIVGL